MMQWPLYMSLYNVIGHCLRNAHNRLLTPQGELLRVEVFTQFSSSLQWRYNGRNGVSNHRRLDCMLNRLFRLRSKKTSKLNATGLCEGKPPVTCGFPSQKARDAENVSIWWRHICDLCNMESVTSNVFSNENDSETDTFNKNMYIYMYTALIYTYW